MRRLQSTIAIAASVPLLLAAITPAVLAQDGDQKTFGDHPAVGTWIIDPETEDLDNTLGLTTVSADGTLRDAAGGPGAGSWGPTGDQTADATILYQAGGPDGFVGFVIVRASLEVAEDGLTFAGTYTVEFPPGPKGLFPAAGVEYGPADVLGERIVVEPMGEPAGPIPEPPPDAAPAEPLEPIQEEPIEPIEPIPEEPLQE